jgi:hypothetical protein
VFLPVSLVRFCWSRLFLLWCVKSIPFTRILVAWCIYQGGRSLAKVSPQMNRWPSSTQNYPKTPILRLKLQQRLTAVSWLNRMFGHKGLTQGMCTREISCSKVTFSVGSPNYSLMKVDCILCIQLK